MKTFAKILMHPHIMISLFIFRYRKITKFCFNEESALPCTEKRSGVLVVGEGLCWLSLLFGTRREKGD